MISGCVRSPRPGSRRAAPVSRGELRARQVQPPQGARERGLAAMRHKPASPQLRGDDRQNDIEHDRQKQRRPRHRDRGQAQQQPDDRGEGEHHDRVVERYLAQREVRVAVGQVRPDEDHRRAGRGGEQNEPGDIAVDLHFRQKRAEQKADEQPAEQRHAERLDEPVDADRDGDAAPRRGHPVERGKIDLDQHRHDHQPDQDGDRDVDLGHGHPAECVKRRRHEAPEHDPGEDAQRHRQRQIAFENTQPGRRRARRRGERCHGRSASAVTSRMPADLVDPAFERHAVELVDRQRDKQLDPVFQEAQRVAKGALLLGLAARRRRRGRAPPNARSPDGPARPGRSRPPPGRRR